MTDAEIPWTPSRASDDRFRHDALLYAGPEQFVERTAAFVRAGVDAGEAVLVVVPGEKVAWLRDELGPYAAEVGLADMLEVGRNPGRIISVWHDYLTERQAEGRRVRGVGEPVYAGRTDAELAECRRHEALLNLAFGGGAPWWLVCPYDTTTLPPAVLADAHRTHPVVMDADAWPSETYAAMGDVLDAPLPEPVVPVDDMMFGGGGLDAVREFVEARAVRHRLPHRRVSDLVLAVHEAATNSLRHAKGRGVVRAWSDGDTFVCEVRDDGRVDDPLIGRLRPTVHQERGRGLWIVHQLCDLVQLRSGTGGTVVRMHVRR